jgi:hypothetical protein
MSSYAEQCEAARMECLLAQARERRRVEGMSIEGVLHEMRADRLERRNLKSEAWRALWSAPTNSFENGSAGRPGPRNVTFRRV